MVSASRWGEVARDVLALVQAVAIVVGAVWAYFKFVRGRTFAERLEASVDATPSRQGNARFVRIRVSLTNTGASIVRLDPDVKVVYVYGVAADDVAPGSSLQWGEHLGLLSVFTRHEWIEAQETVTDEVLATVADREWLAYRVELIVASRNSKRWGAIATVPATLDGERGKKC